MSDDHAAKAAAAAKVAAASVQAKEAAAHAHAEKSWADRHPAAPAKPVPHAADPAAAGHGPASGAPDPDDDFGKVPEAAAVSGAEPSGDAGLAPAGQGAQVVLTGDAQAAARGGTHGDVVANTIARDQAILAGHVVAGTTASAAADATTGAVVDEIDAQEALAIAKAKADAQAARVARAAKPPHPVEHPAHAEKL